MNVTSEKFLRAEADRYSDRLSDLEREIEQRHRELTDLEEERAVVSSVLARVRSHLPAKPAYEIVEDELATITASHSLRPARTGT
jgi:hypothetical protein